MIRVADTSRSLLCSHFLSRKRSWARRRPPGRLEALADRPEIDAGAAREVHVPVRVHRGRGAVDDELLVRGPIRPRLGGTALQAACPPGVIDSRGRRYVRREPEVVTGDKIKIENANSRVCEVQPDLPLSDPVSSISRKLGRIRGHRSGRFTYHQVVTQSYRPLPVTSRTAGVYELHDSPSSSRVCRCCSEAYDKHKHKGTLLERLTRHRH